MNVIERLRLCAFLVCLATTPGASAQSSPEADTREISSYRLSEPALTKYVNATRRLAEVFAGNPPPCDQSSDESLSGMAARLDAIPGATAALSAAGISSREYMVFTLATFQAGMGAWALTEGGDQLPPGISRENVAFFQAHEAELQQQSGLLAENECGGGEEEYENEYDG